MADKLKPIRMLTSLSGEGFSWATNEVVHVEEALAHALCLEPEDSPRAEPVDWELPDKPTSSATREKRETATQPRTRAAAAKA